MKKQIVRFGVLAALLGLNAIQGATIKQGNGFLSEPQQLAQTGAKCNIDETLELSGPNNMIDAGMLHRGQFQSNSAEALVAVSNEQDVYNDH